MTLAITYYLLGSSLNSHGEFKEAGKSFEKAIEINVSRDNLWGIATNKSNLSISYWFLGLINQAYRESSEALQIAEESGDNFSKSLANTIMEPN